MGCMLPSLNEKVPYFMYQLPNLFCSLNCFLQVSIFTEEIIRAGSAASLSSLLNRLDPVLRKTANLGRWIRYSCQYFSPTLYCLKFKTTDNWRY